MKPLYIVILSLFFLNRKVSSQQIDTIKVLFSAKMALLELDQEVKDQKYYEYYMKYNPPYEFLRSGGFDDKIVFFKLKVSPQTDTNKIFVDSVTFKRYIFFGNLRYEFVFGYNTITNVLYRLKGFEENDFEQLYLYIKQYPYYDKDCFKGLKSFLSCFQVEGLDLNCLYNGTIAKKKSKNSECLRKAKPFFDGIEW